MMLLKRKIAISVITVLFLSNPSLAQDCKVNAEVYTKEKIKSSCLKKTCKSKKIDQVTDLAGYPHLKKDEILYRILIQDRFFEVVVKKSNCEKISVYEIGSSDDE